MKNQTPTQPSYFVPEPLDNTRLAHLCGPLDENLRQISAALDVTIFRRGERFIVSGTNADRAVELLERFYAVANKVVPIEEVQLALVEQRSGLKPPAADAEPEPADEDEDEASQEHVTPTLKTRRSDLRGRTPHQIQYIRAVLEHDISFGIGPAGTGKTYLAVACAVDALERDAVKLLADRFARLFFRFGRRGGLGGRLQAGALFDQGQLHFLDRHDLVGDRVEALEQLDRARGIAAADDEAFAAAEDGHVERGRDLAQVLVERAAEMGEPRVIERLGDEIRRLGRRLIFQLALAIVSMLATRSPRRV